MKSKVLIVGAVITAFTFTSFAADALFSPRAQANQIKIISTSPKIPAVALVFVAPGAALLSPRAAGNQIITVASTETVATKCSATGSPKYLALVGKAARMTCCKLTLAECATMDKMN